MHNRNLTFTPYIKVVIFKALLLGKTITSLLHIILKVCVFNYYTLCLELMDRKVLLPLTAIMASPLWNYIMSLTI